MVVDAGSLLVPGAVKGAEWSDLKRAWIRQNA